ncbi:tetraspanin-13a [Rhincodon typus]|uniref:tetraspanin-13a n=1 Tax=Rhincodon typus TaxID=259920 RepID=UPI00202E1023|nr:tetraspanin-13a [Rhincodon typus]
MVCGGFTCSKNSLCILNLLYILVSLLLIGIAAWGKTFGLVTSFSVVAGVIGVGIFLFFIALIGLLGAIKHHQVLLFFYMIILFLVFVVQFSISCASLALNENQQVELLNLASTKEIKSENFTVENNMNCKEIQSLPSFLLFQHCVVANDCHPCGPILKTYAGEVLRFVGGIGLFFSFTEILGVWLTHRYRNQKDPRANPSAFL